MTNKYAAVQGGLITSILDADHNPGEGWAPIPSTFQWSDRPSRAHRPHLIDGAVVWQDDRILADVKAAKWEAIKAARTAAIDAHLVTPYGTFDAGPEDRANITDAVLLVQTMASLGTPTTVTFTTATNTVVTLTTAQMVNVGLLLGAKVQGAYATARALRATIEAAETVAGVDDVTWPAP